MAQYQMDVNKFQQREMLECMRSSNRPTRLQWSTLRRKLSKPLWSGYGMGCGQYTFNLVWFGAHVLQPCMSALLSAMEDALSQKKSLLFRAARGRHVY